MGPIGLLPIPMAFGGRGTEVAIGPLQYGVGTFPGFPPLPPGAGLTLEQGQQEEKNKEDYYSPLLAPRYSYG
jgi:hypothetical protein